MDRELIDRAWRVLPAEFREEVKKEYYHDDSNPFELALLETLFGIHNLTSDAEGEEMLMCEKSKVMKLYNKFQKDGTFTCLYAAGVLDTLFGSKCLPDAPKPTEPKASNSIQNGNTCSVSTYPARHVPENEKSGTRPNYSVFLNSSNPAGRRLSIAAKIVPAILAAQGNGPADEIAADALIKLSEKTNP